MIDRSKWREELKKRFSREPVWPESEIEDGWRDLVCDLTDALDRTEVPYTFDQIKEKWGVLCVYVDAPDDHPKAEEFYRLIEEAEERSETVCEKCGSPGELRKRSAYQTLCGACFEMKRQIDWRFMTREERGRLSEAE